MSGPHIFNKAAPELVERIRSGSHEAFELFYRMEFLNLVHFTGSYLQDYEKARDISQETMLSLWENRKQLDPQKSIRSLVFTIARNKTLNELRRRKLFSPTADVNEALKRLEDNSVEEHINALELTSLMEKIWDSLPKNVAGTFTLSRDEGLKNRIIAEREGVSVKTVEYRIKVALKCFRKLLKDFI